MFIIIHVIIINLTWVTWARSYFISNTRVIVHGNYLFFFYVLCNDKTYYKIIMPLLLACENPQYSYYYNSNKCRRVISARIFIFVMAFISISLILKVAPISLAEQQANALIKLSGLRLCNLRRNVCTGSFLPEGTNYKTYNSDIASTIFKTFPTNDFSIAIR